MTCSTLIVSGVFAPRLLRNGSLAVLVSIAASCRGSESKAADLADTSRAAIAIESVGGDAGAPEARASGTVHVTGSRPSADGDVVITRRVALELPGRLRAYSIDGTAGPFEHTFLVTFDDSGAVRLVTHKWSNADLSVMAQTDCGGRRQCIGDQISADAASGEVTFRGLQLTGLNGNTAAEATSVLTGTIK
jgi:hypothetical protein